MVPTIGLMIGAYVVLRCFEIILRDREYWDSNASRLFVGALALVVACFTIVASADLVNSSLLVDAKIAHSQQQLEFFLEGLR